MARQLKVGFPEFREIADTLRVPGQVEADERTLVRVGANVTGRIVEVNAMLGDKVDSGTVLAKISSPELTKAQLAFLRASSQTTLAERAAERAHQLLMADVIGGAELQRRESELQVFRAELSAATDQLRILGVSSSALRNLAKLGHILPSVEITVPTKGVVIERNVAVGQVVKPSDQLFTIADLSSVWVVGDVPEQSASRVADDQHVEIYIPALRGEKRLEGRIVYVADTVDSETRTVMVRTSVNNEKLKLKPAMLANMYITYVSQKQLVIPEGAVVREDNHNYVFVAQGNDTFMLIPVELGSAVNHMRPVLKGLTIEKRVVLDGAFHLNNERKRADLE
jgi:cobalt-zinc-cadmium efflux system membrane fusion protein